MTPGPEFLLPRVPLALWTCGWGPGHCRVLSSTLAFVSRPGYLGHDIRTCAQTPWMLQGHPAETPASTLWVSQVPPEEREL